MASGRGWMRAGAEGPAGRGQPGRRGERTPPRVGRMSADTPAPRRPRPAAQPEPQPPASAMRRALARARDGKTLDPAEAAVLLHARGDQLAELVGYAARTRDSGLEAAGRPASSTYSRKVSSR